MMIYLIQNQPNAQDQRQPCTVIIQKFVHYKL